MTGPPPPWTDIAVAVTAIVAILLSVFSLYYSRASLELAKAQDRRRDPKLLAEFLAGDYVTDAETGVRAYNVQLSISNPSDSDNAIARAEFRLTYRVNDDTDVTVRLQPSEHAEGEKLATPLRIGAHETVAGWCRFLVAPDIFTGVRIERYMVELTDTHGQAISVTPLLLSERQNVR
jgi:hypothetical protein